MCGHITSGLPTHQLTDTGCSRALWTLLHTILSSCFQFFGVYTQEWNCWVVWSFYVKASAALEEGFPGGTVVKESACPCRRCGFSPWVRKIPWRRKWRPLQRSCLENPMDRGAWRATAHGVAQSRTRLSGRVPLHGQSLGLSTAHGPAWNQRGDTLAVSERPTAGWRETGAAAATPWSGRAPQKSPGASETRGPQSPRGGRQRREQK